MNKLTKILVPVLALALLLGAMIGVSASASGEPTTPEIASMNVEYSSQLYLYYAVPVIDDNGDGENDDVVLNVYSDAECQELLYSVSGTVETIAALGGGSYYVYNTSGVAAKELNTCEYVQAVNTETGAKSEVVEYSVEQYLYTKLYDEGYALMTEDDGKEYIRRTLYYDLLKYGSTAQQLFTPEATDKIADDNYVKVVDAIAKGGEIAIGESIALEYAGSKACYGWNYDSFDAFGNLLSTKKVGDGSVIKVEGCAIATPILENDYNAITFDTLPSTSVFTGPATSDVVITSEVSDGKYLVEDTGTSAGVSLATKRTYTEADADVAIYQATVNISKLANSDGTSIEFYISVYGGSTGSAYRVYWAYFKGASTSDGAVINLDTEYKQEVSADAETGAETISQKGISVKKPVGVVGSDFNIRVEFHEGAVGEAETVIYIDGTEIHRTNAIAGKNYYGSNPASTLPTADQIANVTLSTGAKTTAKLTIDNTCLANTKVANIPTQLEPVGVDPTVINFNAQSEKVTHTTDSYGTYTVVSDPVTGTGYYSISKVSGGSSTFKIAPTYTEENATKAVAEFDMWVSSDATINVQTWMVPEEFASKSSNFKWSPFLFSSQFTSNLVKGSWNTVKIEYLPTAFLADGAEADVFVANLYINGALKGTVTANYGAANTDIPKVSELGTLSFAFNSSAAGEFKIDNASFKFLAD